MPGVELPTDLLWEMASKTALVLALLYGVLWAIRKLNRGVEGARRGPSIQLLHSAHLGPGKSVHLLGVGDRVVLVGATSQQVSLLTEIDQVWQQQFDCDSAPSQPASPFESYLHQAAAAFEGLPARLARRRREGGSDKKPGTGGEK